MTMRRAVSVLLLAGCAGAPAPPPSPASSARPVESSATAPATPSASASATARVARRPLVELQRQTMKHLVAAFNAHDARALAALYTEDAIVRAPSRDGTKEEKGREPLEKGHASLFKSMPDVKIGTRRALSRADVVVWEWTATATATAQKGAPAKPIGFTAASVLWFDDDGRVKVDHTYFDLGALDAQLAPPKKGEKAQAPPTLPAEDRERWVEDTGSDASAPAIAAVTRMYALFEKGDEKGLSTVLDDKGLFPDPATRAPVGKAEWKTRFRAFKKEWPGATVTVDAAFAFDTAVAAEITLTRVVDGKPRVEHRLEIGHFDFNLLGLTSYGNTAAGPER